MWNLAVPWWELIVRSVVIYFALIVALRLFGKRQIGQFTIFDLVLILLVANAVQPAMTGPDNSLLGGLIIIGSLVAVDGVVGLARARIPIVNGLLEPKPTVLAEDGKWQPKAMEEQDVTLEDGEMALREHGIADIEDVQLAVLEADGSISVIPKEASGAGRRPRRRFRLLRRV
jgi:uncharacterized membrane protein YcaP (DUF421 family)